MQSTTYLFVYFLIDFYMKSTVCSFFKLIFTWNILFTFPAIDVSNPFSAKAKENNNDESNSSSIDKHQLSKSLGNVISRIFDEFLDLYSSRAEMGKDASGSEIPEWKQNNSKDEDDPEQYDNQICQTLVKTSLDLGQYGLAKKVVEFFYDNFGDLQKQKKRDEVKDTETDTETVTDSKETTADIGKKHVFKNIWPLHSKLDDVLQIDI